MAGRAGRAGARRREWTWRRPCGPARPGRASGLEAGSADHALPAVSSSLVRAGWPGPPLLCSHWGPCWPADPTPHGQGPGSPSVSRLWNEPWGGRCSSTWASHLAVAGPPQEGGGQLAGLGVGGQGQETHSHRPSALGGSQRLPGGPAACGAACPRLGSGGWWRPGQRPPDAAAPPPQVREAL